MINIEYLIAFIAKVVWRMIMGIRDRADGTILKNDIFNAVFVFASDAEK